MWKWFLRIFLLLLFPALLAFVLWQAYSMPVEYRLARSFSTANSPSAVWSALTEVELYPQWNQRIMVVQSNHAEWGGLEWTEGLNSAEGGNITRHVVHGRLPDSLKIAAHSFTLRWQGEQQWRFEPLPDGGCLVQVVETGQWLAPLQRLWRRVQKQDDELLVQQLTALESYLQKPYVFPLAAVEDAKEESRIAVDSIKSISVQKALADSLLADTLTKPSANIDSSHE
jgi:hypothetical protein